MRRTIVAYVFPTSHKFRVPFHERLRELLGRSGIEYHYIYSEVDNFGKGDTESIPWAQCVPLTRLRIGPVRLSYQHAFWAVRDADMVILQQENSLLVNYAVQVLYRMAGKKVAFFGHGRNFQAPRAESLSEKFKCFWLTKVDWWFAYTQRSADIVASSGFPTDHITVFNNAIDTSAIQTEKRSLNPAAQSSLRQSLCGGSVNVGVYVGGLYPQKRLAFLLEAAKLVHAEMPDFQLLIIGDGQDAELAKAAAAEYSWMHYLGPKFGPEKTALVSLSRVFLMPGLVGLAVLDSFAYGTPMVTTDIPYHSPEIEYLKNGENGLVVKDDIHDYAAAVLRVLRDGELRKSLQRGAAKSLRSLTIETMVNRFADGVLRALRL